jgi:hypothetical protein
LPGAGKGFILREELGRSLRRILSYRGLSDMASDINKARLAALKKIGLLPNISNRGKLSEGQKRTVRETYKKYEAVASAPKGTYSNVSVAKLTKHQKEMLTEYGIPVVGNRAYVPVAGFQKVHLARGTSYAPVTEGASRNRFFRQQTPTIDITRTLEVAEGSKKFTKKEVERIYDLETATMEQRIDQMIARLGPLGPHEHYAVKTKGHQVYRRGSATDAASLKAFIFQVGASASSNPKSPIAEDDLFSDIQIVKIDMRNEGFQYDPSEISQAEYGRRKARSARKRRKTKVRGKRK